MHKMEGPNEFSRICGTMELLPQPVGPTMMVSLLERILSTMRSFRVLGKELRFMVDDCLYQFSICMEEDDCK